MTSTTTCKGHSELHHEEYDDLQGLLGPYRL